MKKDQFYNNKRKKFVNNVVFKDDIQKDLLALKYIKKKEKAKLIIDK